MLPRERAMRRTPSARCGSSAWTTRRAPRWPRSTATASSGSAPTPIWCSWRRCACRWSRILVISSTFEAPVHGRRRTGMRIIVGLVMVLLASSVPASAQSPPPPQLPALQTSTPWVGLPWGLGPAIPQGQMLRQSLTVPGAYVRDIWIPPQPVVVEAMVALPAQAGSAVAAAGPATRETEYGVVRQSYTVPGYYVRQTTVGIAYPERW